MMYKQYKLPLIVFIMTFILLAFVQIKIERPMILAERFLKGSGWVEIFLISCYGAFVVNKMKDPMNVPKWRKICWTTFSLVFFTQLIIGLSGFDKFLMTGKLHLPIPMMILAGPIYRGQLSVMTILFLSTVILTGPAWCSQLCYFGAFDNLSSGGKSSKEILKYKGAIKSTVLIFVIAMAFGVGGILIMILYSLKRKKMVHCVMYCPIGTIVNVFKHINPFRMHID